MNDKLKTIYAKTDGRCHLSGKKLSFTNYGTFGARGAWEIEHSVPKSKGGSDHMNNLYPACIAANRAKGNVTTRTARAGNGLTRAPRSAEGKEQLRQENAWKGLGLGVLGIPFGPIGVGVLATIGALIRYNEEVD